MTHRKQFLISMASALCLIAASVSAQAEVTLNAHQIYYQIMEPFNNLNDGKGFSWTRNFPADLPKDDASMFLSLMATFPPNWPDWGQADISAYAPSKAGYYYTGVGDQKKCYFTSLSYNPRKIESGDSVSSGYAKLQYQYGDLNHAYTSNADGKNLTVGVAALYTHFSLGYFDADYDAVALQTATQFLFDGGNDSLGVNNDYYWGGNKYLQYLLAMNSDQNYWRAAYDLVHNYAEIGDYLVFIMDMQNENGNHINIGDYLYLARKSDNPVGPIRPNNPGGGDGGDDPEGPGTGGGDDGNGGGGDGGDGNSGVPEPATLLLWTLGGLGLTGTSWARNRRMKKLALS
jgi:hypothetical protein